MRKLMLLALSAFLTLNAHAAHRVTVAQLEEALSAAAAEQRADGDIARQIGGMTLSERLTTVTLDRLAARLKVQPRTALSLQLLSDQSAFLDPPPSELPATAPPDQPEQKRSDRSHQRSRRTHRPPQEVHAHSAVSLCGPGRRNP